MAAYKSGSETIPLRKVGRNKRKDVRWDTVDACERILPLADSCKRGRNISFELRNRIERGATEDNERVVSQSGGGFTTYRELEYAVRFSSSLRAKTSCEGDRPFPG